MKDKDSRIQDDTLSVLGSLKRTRNSSKSLSQTNDIADLAVEVWRIEKKIKGLKHKLSEDENMALDSSLNRLKNFLSKNDVSYMDFTENKYNQGMNVVEVLLFEKDSTLKNDIIYQTHEPAVFYLGKLYRKAKVIVHEK